MTTRRDVIAVPPIQVPVRPFYALGVLLASDDLVDEQSYHRGRLARGLKYLFGTGTVAGLDVTWREATQQLVVNPGIALDPLGRLIQISRPVAIRLRGGPGAEDSWFDVQLPQDLDGWITGTPRQIVADVFVRFVVCERSKTPAFKTGPFDALTAVTPTRLRDGYEVALVIRREAFETHDIASIPIPDDIRILNTRPVDPAQAIAWAQRRILLAWRDRFGDDWSNGTNPEEALPHPLEEHVTLGRSASITFPAPGIAPGSRIENDPTEVGRDPTSVLLARVRIAVSNATVPVDLGQTPIIERFTRRFIRSSGVYTQPGDGA